MKKEGSIAEVGAADPEHRTPPIVDDDWDEVLAEDLDAETGVCYFNSQAFRIGDYVRSGSELLHCEERGVWVRKGS